MPQFAKLRGINVTLLYFALVLMVALGVVIIIRAVGLILVIALLTIPPYIAEKFTKFCRWYDGCIVYFISSFLCCRALSFLQL